MHVLTSGWLAPRGLPGKSATPAFSLTKAGRIRGRGHEFQTECIPTGRHHLGHGEPNGSIPDHRPSSCMRTINRPETGNFADATSDAPTSQNSLSWRGAMAERTRADAMAQGNSAIQSNSGISPQLARIPHGLLQAVLKAPKSVMLVIVCGVGSILGTTWAQAQTSATSCQITFNACPTNPSYSGKTLSDNYNGAASN